MTATFRSRDLPTALGKRAVRAIDENRGVDNKVPFPRSGLFAEVTASIEENSFRLYGHPKPGNSWTARTAVRPAQTARILREMIDPYEMSEVKSGLPLVT